MDSQCFEGNQKTVIAGTGTLADANYSVDGGTATHTNYDNSAKFYTNAKAVISCSFAVAPDDQSTVDLYISELNISGTSDVTPPAATDIQAARWVGSFKLYNTTAQQYQTTNISLFGVKDAVFSIQNNGGQTMDADFTVTLEGFSLYDI